MAKRDDVADAKIALIEEQTRHVATKIDLNNARADAAAMRKSLEWYQRGDFGIICHCEGANMCDLHKAYKATDGDAGRALLAEVAGLREEVADAALKAVDCEAQNDRVVSALGRAHAALSRAREWVGCACDTEGLNPHNDGCLPTEMDAVLADSEGRAAAEYVAALEAEHEAVGNYRKSIATHVVYIGGGDLDDAHAAVEALRGK